MANDRRYSDMDRKPNTTKNEPFFAPGRVDSVYLILALLLLAMGLVMMLSASYPYAFYKVGDALYYFKRQVFSAILGLAAMVTLPLLNIKFFRGKLTLIALFGSTALLLAILIPFLHLGVTYNNATRWIRLGLEFQPSELAKVAIILFLADYIERTKDQMRKFKSGVFTPLMFVLPATALILVEPHLSGAVLVATIIFVMLSVGGIKRWVILLGVGAAIFLVYAYLNGWIQYNMYRIIIWRDPFNEEYVLNKGYQMSQSLMAIGSGGLTGLGLGKSRQKFLYLPEEFNDFIFAITCEELGLIGATIIMIVFAVFIWRGFYIAMHASDRYSSLIAVGVTTQLAAQTFLNMAVVSGLVPNTGISLPFFSYGGTALVIQMVEVGLVLSVSKSMKDTQVKRKQMEDNVIPIMEEVRG